MSAFLRLTSGFPILLQTLTLGAAWEFTKTQSAEAKMHLCVSWFRQFTDRRASWQFDVRVKQRQCFEEKWGKKKGSFLRVEMSDVSGVKLYLFHPKCKLYLCSSLFWQHNHTWQHEQVAHICGILLQTCIDLMRLDTSSVMYPGGIRCFRSFNIIPPDPAGVDRAPACVQDSATLPRALLAWPRATLMQS